MAFRTKIGWFYIYKQGRSIRFSEYAQGFAKKTELPAIRFDFKIDCHFTYLVFVRGRLI